jgi:large subunit ribosomal protein L25
MATFVTIEANARERAGKGGARATRRAGKVPGIVYGARQEPSLIALDPRIVLRELHRGGWRSRLYELKVGDTATRALIRDVQFHPVSDAPEHIDFQRLAAGEAIRVSVSVHFVGELASPGIKRGGVLNVVRHQVEVLCDPDSVPDHFEADLGPLDINDNIRWSDLKGTAGMRPAIADRDFVIATVASPSKLPEPVADPNAPAAAAAAPAKGAAPKGAAPAKAAPAKAAPAKAAPAKAAAKPAAKPAGKK